MKNWNFPLNLVFHYTKICKCTFNCYLLLVLLSSILVDVQMNDKRYLHTDWKIKRSKKKMAAINILQIRVRRLHFWFGHEMWSMNARELNVKSCLSTLILSFANISSEPFFLFTICLFFFCFLFLCLCVRVNWVDDMRHTHTHTK